MILPDVNVLVYAHREHLSRSNGSASSIHRQRYAMNETGALCCQENNSFSDLVCGGRTPRRCLGGKLVQRLPHGACAFGARRARAYSNELSK